MNTAKTYKDIDDNECTIHQMVRREPGWAASRIQVGEKALEVLELIKTWDIENYMVGGAYVLPPYIRKRIQALSK